MVEADANPGATTLAVTSGKGGVGKTSLATNLAIALRRRGNAVCLLDADMGLANVNILLGVQPEHTLDDLAAGRVTLGQLMIEGPEGLHILPAAAGLERLAVQAPDSQPGLIGTLAELERRYDYLLLDTPAGIGATTKAFIHPCDLSVLVITPEPTSLTDAFTLLRTVLREGFDGQVSVVVNMLPGHQDGHRLFERFRAAAEHYLNVQLDYLGSVPMDRDVTQAVLNQHPLLLGSPDSAASSAMEMLAGRLLTRHPPQQGRHRFADTWQRLAETARQRERASVNAASPGAQASEEEAEDEPGAIPETLTPPREIRAASDRPLEDIAQAAETLLQSDELAEGDARSFFNRLERSFTARFRRRASDIKALLYESLLQEQLSEPQLRELRDILVESYARRFAEQPEMPDTSRESPAPASPEQARRILGELYNAPEWDEALSRELLATIQALHAERFRSAPAASASDAELEALQARFRDTQQALQARMTEACLLLEEHARLLTNNGGTDDDN